MIWGHNDDIKRHYAMNTLLNWNKLCIIIISIFSYIIPKQSIVTSMAPRRVQWHLNDQKCKWESSHNILDVMQSSHIVRPEHRNSRNNWTYLVQHPARAVPARSINYDCLLLERTHTYSDRTHKTGTSTMGHIYLFGDGTVWDGIENIHKLLSIQ